MEITAAESCEELLNQNIRGNNNEKRLLVIAVLLMAAFVCITVLNGMDTELSPSEPSGSGTAATDTADIKPSSKGSPYKFYFERLTPVEKRAYNAIIEKYTICQSG